MTSPILKILDAIRERCDIEARLDRFADDTPKDVSTRFVLGRLDRTEKALREVVEYLCDDDASSGSHADMRERIQAILEGKDE